MALLGNTAQLFLQMTLVAGPPVEVQVKFRPLVDTLLTVGMPTNRKDTTQNHVVHTCTVQCVT